MEEAYKTPGKNTRGQIRLQHREGHYLNMEVIFRNLLNNENIKGIIGNYQVLSE